MITSVISWIAGFRFQCTCLSLGTLTYSSTGTLVTSLSRQTRPIKANSVTWQSPVTSMYPWPQQVTSQSRSLFVHVCHFVPRRIHPQVQVWRHCQVIDHYQAPRRIHLQVPDYSQCRFLWWLPQVRNRQFKLDHQCCFCTWPPRCHVQGDSNYKKEPSYNR